MLLAASLSDIAKALIARLPAANNADMLRELEGAAAARRSEIETSAGSGTPAMGSGTPPAVGNDAAAVTKSTSTTVGASPKASGGSPGGGGGGVGEGKARILELEATVLRLRAALKGSQGGNAGGSLTDDRALAEHSLAELEEMVRRNENEKKERNQCFLVTASLPRATAGGRCAIVAAVAAVRCRTSTRLV